MPSLHKRPATKSSATRLLQASITPRPLTAARIAKPASPKLWLRGCTAPATPNAVSQVFQSGNIPSLTCDSSSIRVQRNRSAGVFDTRRELGRGHHCDRLCHQALDVQAGIAAATEANGQVDVLQREVHQAPRLHQAQFHVGMARVDIVQARDQPARGEHRWRGDHQRAAVVAGAHSGHGVFELIEGFGDQRQDGVRRDHPGRAP